MMEIRIAGISNVDTLIELVFELVCEQMEADHKCSGYIDIPEEDLVDAVENEYVMMPYYDYWWVYDKDDKDCPHALYISPCMDSDIWFDHMEAYVIPEGIMPIAPEPINEESAKALEENCQCGDKYCCHHKEAKDEVEAGCEETNCEDCKEDVKEEEAEEKSEVKN